MKFQKNYKIPFLSFLLFYFSIQLFSQQSVIQGIVKDSLTQGTITYAAIYLRNDKDSVVSYVYTDEQGSFKLPVSDITKGSLFVEMLGYNKWTKTLDFSGETRFFEQIFLSPNVNLLGEIEISDSANKVVHRLDRDIHV
ncbi:MAG: carboxypeptidase-like regulatory domain-containing protein, partial [Bacteroidales bacterium]|nr:carboxypeptidase-like regulatory domain-containing protein [Bacteroidales bacterium]